MPPETASKVRVKADDLRAMVTGIFAARGTTDAAAVADALVWANLRGIDSHGVSRVPRYLELFDKGESAPDAVPTVQRPRAAIAIVDAHGAPGPVAMNRAVAEAVAAARECGVGWASVRGTVHTGAIGYYTSQAAAAGIPGFTVAATRELGPSLEKAVATVRGGHSALVNVVLSKLSTERSVARAPRSSEQGPGQGG